MNHEFAILRFCRCELNKIMNDIPVLFSAPNNLSVNEKKRAKMKKKNLTIA